MAFTPWSPVVNVCHLIDHLAHGGAQSLLLDLVRRSADDRLEFTVCSLGSRTRMRPKFEHAGATVVECGATSAADLAAVFRLARLLGRGEFDVLHTHLVHAQTVGRLGRFLFDVPCLVTTFHNTAEHYHPNAAIGAVERHLRRVDDVHVAVSEGVKESFPGGDDWRVVPNGIDVETFQSAVSAAETAELRSKYGAHDPVFLNVGRCVPQKSQVDAILAMTEVVDHLPEAHLIIVGSGELERDLTEAVAAHGLYDHVTVTGEVPSVHEYYAIADAFVLPSVHEGLPITVLEAMASGLPVVGTDVAGINEVVDCETGRLVSPRSQDALADAMVGVSTPERRVELGEAGLERVRSRYDIHSTVAAYHEIYADVISSYRRGESYDAKPLTADV